MYLAEVNILEGNTYWCNTCKKHIQVQPKIAGFVSTAVLEFYDDLRKAISKDPTFIAATRFADCSFKLEEANVRQTFRAAGGGCRCKVPEIPEELFQWFDENKHQRTIT